MPTLPADWLTIFSAGASHRLGSCSADGTPGICRALAADVWPDGRVLVLTARRAGPDVIDAIAATGQVALVLAVPGLNRTLHLKGRDAQVLRSEPEDQALLQQRLDAFAQRLLPFGFSAEALSANWYRVAEEGLVRIVFSISGAWNQTPGPGAGQAVDLL